MVTAPGGLGADSMDCELLDDRTAVADYIADLTAELALLAAWADYTDLARILEVARLESEQLCGRPQNVAAASAASDATSVGDIGAGPFVSTNVIRLSTRAAQS